MGLDRPILQKVRMASIDPKKKGKKRKKRDKRRKYKKGRGATNLKSMTAKEESASTGKRAYTKADKKTANMWAGSSQGKQSFGGGSGGSNLVVNVYTSGGKGGGGGGKGGGGGRATRPTKAEVNREKARATAETTARTAETSRTQAEYRLNETRRQERQPPVYLQLGNTANVVPQIAQERGVIDDRRSADVERRIDRRMMDFREQVRGGIENMSEQQRLLEETQKRMAKQIKQGIRGMKGVRDDIRESQEREPPRRPPRRPPKSRSKSKSKSPEETDPEQKELEKRALLGTPDKDEVLSGGGSGGSFSEYSGSEREGETLADATEFFARVNVAQREASVERGRELTMEEREALKDDELKIWADSLEEQKRLREISEEVDEVEQSSFNEELRRALEGESSSSGEDMTMFEREEPKKNIVIDPRSESMRQSTFSEEEEAKDIKKAKGLSLKGVGSRKSPKQNPRKRG